MLARIYHIFLLFFLMVFVAKSQETKRFSLKPMLGITACQVHGDNYSGYNKLGFTGGLYVNAVVKKQTSIELGIIFIQKGAQRNPNPAKFDYTAYYLNLNYVEVPLLLRWQHKKFFFTGGVSFAYLINYYEATEISSITGMFPFKSNEYSFNLGIGMTITPKIGVEVRANNSFITIRPWPSSFRPYYNNIMARTFNNGSYSNILQIAFTYKLGGKKSNEAKNEPKEEI